jgi:2-polyprenyl-6-hydroxyphenyl methylase/3-demethylubiquinone-9 3-methyltransferase
MENNYYAQNLNAQKLWQVYDTRIPSVSRYLEQETAFVREQMKKTDAVLCLQNGLSAIKDEFPETFAAKVIKALKNGGKTYFSTYHPKFWEQRLAWFEEQSRKGLIGELDMEKTKNGVIVCKDGFRATTHSIADLEKIGRSTGCRWQIFEVDDSSIFLVIEKQP